MNKENVFVAWLDTIFVTAGLFFIGKGIMEVPIPFLRYGLFGIFLIFIAILIHSKL